jgi:hypothetical protein
VKPAFGYWALEFIWDLVIGAWLLLSQFFLFLAGIGEEKRRSEFIDSKRFDDILGFFSDHEVSKSLCSSIVDLGPLRRIDLDDMVDV